MGAYIRTDENPAFPDKLKWSVDMRFKKTKLFSVLCTVFLGFDSYAGIVFDKNIYVYDDDVLPTTQVDIIYDEGDEQSCISFSPSESTPPKIIIPSIRADI